MRSSLIITVFFLISLAVRVDAGEKERKNPHTLAENDCITCHIDAENDPAMLRKPVTELCRGCHLKTVRSNTHSVDIVPGSMTIPQGLPLEDGKMTCITCHFPHVNKSGSESAGDSLLRREMSGSVVSCESCHKGNRESSGHEDALFFAHLATKYKSQGQPDSLDSLSLICIGCHDGSMGKNVTYAYITSQTSHSKVSSFDQSSSHPVGVQYKTSREHNKLLAPTHKIHKDIKLFDGKVGCGTCHDAYSSEPNKLVMSNKGSGLCFQCHYL